MPKSQEMIAFLWSKRK